MAAFVGDEQKDKYQGVQSTHRVGFNLGVTHPPAHVRVNRENQCLDEEPAIERDTLEVDLLRCIVDGRFPGNGEI